MRLTLSRPVDTLLRHADEDLMDLVDALGVEGTNLGAALENVRRMLSQATRQYAAEHETRGAAYGECISHLTCARTALIVGDRDACEQHLDALDCALRQYLIRAASGGPVRVWGQVALPPDHRKTRCAHLCPIVTRTVREYQ